jgi:TonB family protein
MFESVATAVSPRRSHLAGPAAAVAHGLVFAGLIGAALWDAADLTLPDPPERPPILSIPVAITGTAGRGGGGQRDVKPPKGHQRAAAGANSFPSRLPDQIASATGREIPVADLPGRGPETSGFVDGEGEGSGDCPNCPIGLERGGDTSDVVDGSVVAPILVRRVEPSYPETSRKLRQEGRVVLEAIIGRNGAIEEIRVFSSANALLDDAAVKAVSQWRYKPCLHAGHPVRVRLLVTVNFRLN